MRIRKHGGLVDVDKDGKVVITPFAGQQVDITGDLDVSGSLTKDGVAILAGLNAVVYKGATDCSANPNYPAADAGDLYMVSVAGKIGGASGVDVEAGDMFICKTDGTLTGTQAQRGTAWSVIQTNIISTAGVPDSTNRRYLTDAQLVVVGNTSGTNSGDSASDPAGSAATAQAAAQVAAESTAAAALLVESNQRIGNDAQYIRTTNGAQTLLGGNAVARAIIIVVEIDTTFAAGDGAAPLFDIGETGSLTKFATGLTTGTAGDKLFFAGFLSANTALIITATQATGATSTGAIHVTALALPEA